MTQAALVPCDGYYGAFARLNDQPFHTSWPLWMRLDMETLQPLDESWTLINITDWVPLNGRGFRSSGYEDLRVGASRAPRSGVGEWARAHAVRSAPQGADLDVGHRQLPPPRPEVGRVPPDARRLGRCAPASPAVVAARAV